MDVLTFMPCYLFMPYYHVLSRHAPKGGAIKTFVVGGSGLGMKGVEALTV